jgi:hypothetical protein
MSGTTPVIYSHAVGKLHPNPSAGFPAGSCDSAAARSKDWNLAVSRYSRNTDRLTVHTASQNAACLHSCRDLRAIRG